MLSGAWGPRVQWRAAAREEILAPDGGLENGPKIYKTVELVRSDLSEP